MMDDRRSEDLKTQMAKTRSKLADKLETLEEKLIEPAAAAVSETVTTVKEAVGHTADAVQSTMKHVSETFDLSAHVRKHPWPMLGAGFATGFLLNRLVKVAMPLSTPAGETIAAPPDSSSPVTGPDLQHNRLNGVYSATQAGSDVSPRA